MTRSVRMLAAMAAALCLAGCGPQASGSGNDAFREYQIPLSNGTTVRCLAAGQLAISCDWEHPVAC